MRYIDDELRDHLSDDRVLRYKMGASLSIVSTAYRLASVISAVSDVAQAYHESTVHGAPASDALQVLELLWGQIRVCNRDLESAVLSLAIGHGRPAVGSDVLAKLHDQIPLLRLFDTPPEGGGAGHDSSSPVGDGCASLCKPTGEGLTLEERYRLIGACICLSSALQGQGSVSGSGGVRDGFDRYAQHRDLIGKVTEHLILGGQISPVAREFLTRDLADLIVEISLQSFDAFQRIFDGIQFIHDSSSSVGDETLSFPSDPTGEGSTSGSDEGVA